MGVGLRGTDEEDLVTGEIRLGDRRGPGFTFETCTVGSTVKIKALVV